MAKSTRDPPRLFETVAVNDGELMERPEDEDSEAAWEGWISNLRAANGSGLIRVAKLPTDEHGTPLPNSKGQVQLMSCPHDQYDYDSLLAHIRQRFMKPGEVMHVRIVGVEPGKPGIKVNNIVSLQRDAALSTEPEGVTSQLGEVLTAMREDRTAMVALLQNVVTPKEPAPVAPTLLGSPVMGEVLKIGLPIVGAIVTALITRPAKPPADLMGLVEIARMLRGESPEEKEDDNSWQGLVKAVAPSGLQLLTTLAQNAQRPVPAPARSAPLPAARPASLPTLANANGGLVNESAISTVDRGATSRQVETPAALSVSTSPTATTSEDSSMFALLKPQVEELCELAARNEDPVQVAALTLQMLPEQFDEPLGSLVESPEAFARLSLLVPRMKEYPQWFESLRVELAKSFTVEP